LFLELIAGTSHHSRPRLLFYSSTFPRNSLALSSLTIIIQRRGDTQLRKEEIPTGKTNRTNDKEEQR
jgi:hypothetical protein